MKKILGILFVIILIVIAIPYFYLNTIIKNTVESQGSRILNTKVSLSSSRLSIMDGEGSLKQLKIANPIGFSDQPAFLLKNLDIAVDLKSLWHNTIIVNDITIESPEISYEVSPKGNNVYALYNNVQSANARANPKGTGKGSAKKKIIVKHLKITGGKVHLSLAVPGYNKEQGVDFPDIELKDIGAGKGGVTAEELAQIIFTAITKNISGPADQLMKGGTRELKDKLGGFLKRF